MCFSPYLGIGCKGGGQTGLIHNLLMQFYSSKIEVFETYFFDIVIT